MIAPMIAPKIGPKIIRSFSYLAELFLVLALFVLACLPISAQQNPKRLIMKDGTYQAANQWEITGDRVRYYSVERYDWEEIPKELVDWPATEKYNKELAGVRDATIKEIAKADEADEREAPLVIPGLRLPSTGGVFLLDTFRDQPQHIALRNESAWWFFHANPGTEGRACARAVTPGATGNFYERGYLRHRRTGFYAKAF
jgi:hypothetical protein